MSWNVSVKPLTKRLPLQPTTTGGFGVEDRPNPNDPSFRMNRGPVIGPNSGDRAGNALMARAMANRIAGDYDRSTEMRALGAPAPLSTVLPDNRWEGLKQALYEAGVDRLQTGARSKMAAAPGFFDTQHSIEDERVQRLLEALASREGR